MSVKHKHRFYLVSMILAAVALATGLIVYALRQNINVFYTPTEINDMTALNTQTIRVGGMVVAGSFKRFDDLKVQFTLTDFNQEVVVHYRGILPDLFREGQGIVTEGKLTSNGFEAKTVLAKHDENYMPRELRDTLVPKNDT